MLKVKEYYHNGTHIIFQNACACVCFPFPYEVFVQSADDRQWGAGSDMQKIADIKRG